MKRIIFTVILFLVAELLYSQNDCPSMPVCAGFSNTPNGTGVGGQFGEINAGTDGCLSGEHGSTWVTITILTSGSLQFTINPNVNSDDFDFAVWGPGNTCPPATTPIKCSWAAGGGNTGVNSGLNVSGGANSEGSAGDGWVNNIAVTAGQTYLILVDNFIDNNNGFAMTFGGTSTLDCSILPIELISFNGINEGVFNLLTFSTASEINNDYFKIERSQNGYDWIEIAKIDGAGNSSNIIDYSFKDYEFKNGLNYYRLIQVDYDGSSKTFDPISINNIRENSSVIRITNLIGQEVSEDYEGLRIIYYSDGSFIRKIGK